MADLYFNVLSNLIGFWPVVLIFMVVGVLGLKFGADWLVDGAANLGFRFQMSATMIGLTIVAFGTSAPELVVSIVSAMEQKSALVLGNVVGSNIANTALIMGATAVIFPLTIGRDTLKLDAPHSTASILLVCMLSLIGAGISRLDGVILLLTFTVWMSWLIRKSLREAREARQDNEDAMHFLEEEGVHIHKRPPAVDITWIVAGLVVLVIGARMLVIGASNTADTLGVSEVVVGLTVVAIGTSLPELAVSVSAAMRKQADITVGNVLGSNIFNALLILGICAVIHPIYFDLNHPQDRATVFVDIPFCLFLCLGVIPLMAYKKSLGRKRGSFLLVVYVSYMLYLVFRSMG